MFIFASGGGGVGGEPQNWPFFVDVINVWPLDIPSLVAISLLELAPHHPNSYFITFLITKSLRLSYKTRFSKQIRIDFQQGDNFRFLNPNNSRVNPVHIYKADSEAEAESDAGVSTVWTCVKYVKQE